MHPVPKKKQGKDYTRRVMHIPKPWYEHLDVLNIRIPMFFWVRLVFRMVMSKWLVILLMEEILHQLGCIKPCKYYHINWCRISSINHRISSFFHCDKVLQALLSVFKMERIKPKRERQINKYRRAGCEFSIVY